MIMLARPSLLLVAVIVAGMSLGHSLSRADELPADTNTIERLTPEQAKALAEFRGWAEPEESCCRVILYEEPVDSGDHFDVGRVTARQYVFRHRP